MIATIIVCIGVIIWVGGWIEIIINKVQCYHECKNCTFRDECISYKRYFPKNCIKRYYLMIKEVEQIYREIKAEADNQLESGHTTN